MRIAIIGSGISGLVAAYKLHAHHDVTVFEAQAYPGGHTNTVDVDDHGTTLSVDTGFIVYNERTYPHFVRLLRELQVETQPTTMGFSLRCDRTGLEYAGTSLNGLFAQRANLVSGRFWQLLREWLRFNRRALEFLSAPDPDLSVGDFLRHHRFHSDFVDWYFLPMGSAIWSCPRERFRDFPLQFILEFYRNHGLLGVFDRPQWRVIRGGSRRYVAAMTTGFRDRIRLKCGVRQVSRGETDVELTLRDGSLQRFDHVIFACHSDQALQILGNGATATEREVLSSFPYEKNIAILHTDASILPRRRRAWASWNYRLPPEGAESATVTYNMNILQGIQSDQVYCVTLNDESAIAPERVLRRIEYHHPVFSTNRAAMQQRHGELLDENRTSYCGAYWRNGFHEDGVATALAVCATLAPESRCVGPGGEPAMNSCLYEGWVRHRRFAPTQNQFRYRLFFVYLDLAELGQVFHGRWLWSTDRPNWAWFRREDHLGSHSQSLDEAVRDLVQAAGLDRPTGAIRLLTHLRYGGFVFNPVSFYFCFDAMDQLMAVVAEVNNTPWGERHCYVLRPEDLRGSANRLLAKEFHVSPFMTLDMQYRWLLGTPGEHLAAHLENVQDGVTFFDVTMQLERQPLDSRPMSSILWRHPWMTGKIVAAIYWQALRLWWKGTPFVPHPRHVGPKKGALHAPASVG